MKKVAAALTALSLSLSLAVSGPADANEKMKDSKAAPDSSTYTVYDFTFSGLDVFNGKTYVTGWQKYKIAVPKQVKCSDHLSDYLSNCIAYIRSSVETSLSSDPNAWEIGPYLDITLDGPTEKKSTSLFPAFKKLVPVGSEWAESTVYFRAAVSGTVNLIVTPKGTGGPVAAMPFTISVRTQAEVDAENAAKAAAAKAKQDEADRKERERISRILSTKLIITCKSGGKTKKVTGDPPSCPKGYTNSMGSHVTFKAYSQCKLYKKQYGYSRAYLQDGGKTLQLDGYGRGYSAIDLSDADWSCVVRNLKIPGSVQNKIGQTRALDGMVSARFAGIEAFWTYHPDNGLDITFSK